MQVILLDKVANLGSLGDQVNVKAGYARNFLVPQGKAVPATKKNIEFFEARRAEPVSYTHLDVYKRQPLSCDDGFVHHDDNVIISFCSDSFRSDFC